MKKDVILFLVVSLLFLPAVAKADPSLVGYWKFDEGMGDTAYDSSGYGNHGVLNGPIWDNGIIGNGLEFDGASDYIYVENSASLNISDSITVMSCVKVEGTTTDHQEVCVKWYGVGGEDVKSFALELQPDAKTPQFAIYTNTGTREYAVSDTLLHFGKWTHLAGTYDGDTIKIYVNGVLTGSRPISGKINVGNQPVLIGSHSHPEDRNYFHGIIDEVKIYRRALSEQEINTEYPSLAGYWKFDEGTDTTAYDSSGYGNDGALMNGPVWVDGLPLLGKALVFDGTDDYVDVNSPSGIPTGASSRTLMAWLKTSHDNSEGTQWKCIVGYGEDALPYRCFSLAQTTENKLAVGGCWYDCISGISINDGKWHHAAATYDGETVNVYLDGAIAATCALSYNTGLTFFKIGSADWAGNAYFNGTIDEIKIYHRVLSPEEIQEEILKGVIRGDVNFDNQLTVSDVVYLINYLFKGGSPPTPVVGVGDANCDGTVSVSDVIYLINYLFKGGPAPSC